MTVRRVLSTASLWAQGLRYHPPCLCMRWRRAACQPCQYLAVVVPPDRIKLLSASELATYGISALDAVALEARRTHSQFLPR
jgi:hypothetical protein